MRVHLQDDQFVKMMDLLRQGENIFTFTDEDGYIEETFELVRPGLVKEVENRDTGEIYASVSDAAEKLGISRPHLSRVLNQSHKSGTLKGRKSAMPDLRWYFGIHDRKEWVRHVNWKARKQGGWDEFARTFGE